MKRPILLLFSGLALVVTACGHSEDPANSSLMSTAPSLEGARSIIAQDSGNRYPLAIGTRWAYDGVERASFHQDGRLEFGPWKTSRFRVTEEAVRITSIEGQDYFEIDVRIYDLDGTHPEIPLRDRRYLRQDRVALYEFPNQGGIGAVEPAVRLGPAPLRQENVRLAYPLHVGASWTARPGSSRTFEVEAIEPIRTGMGVEPAARVRARSPELLPSDVSDLEWYGRSGLVRSWKRSYEEHTTPLGVHGTQLRISEQFLTSFTPG